MFFLVVSHCFASSHVLSPSVNVSWIVSFPPIWRLTEPAYNAYNYPMSVVAIMFSNVKLLILIKLSIKIRLFYLYFRSMGLGRVLCLVMMVHHWSFLIIFIFLLSRDYCIRVPYAYTPSPPIRTSPRTPRLPHTFCCKELALSLSAPSSSMGATSK